MNVAEILLDRGELEEAQAFLLETLPRVARVPLPVFLGGCLWLLGRVSLRAGRIEEALTRLEEARALFVAVKREEEVLDVDARIAECRTFAGDADAALALRRTRSRAPRVEAGAKAMSLLERVHGHALLCKGDFAGARRRWRRASRGARATRPAGDYARAALPARVEPSPAGTSPRPTWSPNSNRWSRGSRFALDATQCRESRAGLSGSISHANEKRPRGPLFIVADRLLVADTKPSAIVDELVSRTE